MLSFVCGRWYCDETCHQFEVRIGKHSGIYLTFNKGSKSKKSTAVKDHMLMCNQLVSFEIDFKGSASPNSEFHLKIKESYLISGDQPSLNKN